MQEHYNFWLEELAQHKGKDFDDVWYRFVLSMHIHHFLCLKEEFEEMMDLAPRRKNHTEPHLNNELREALRIFRDKDIHCCHKGRDMGYHSKDHLTEGYKILDNGRVQDFIEESLHAHNSIYGETVEESGTRDPTYMCRPVYYEDGRLRLPTDEELEACVKWTEKRAH